MSRITKMYPMDFKGLFYEIEFYKPFDGADGVRVRLVRSGGGSDNDGPRMWDWLFDGKSWTGGRPPSEIQTDAESLWEALRSRVPKIPTKYDGFGRLRAPEPARVSETPTEPEPPTERSTSLAIRELAVLIAVATPMTAKHAEKMLEVICAGGSVYLTDRQNRGVFVGPLK